MSTYTSCPSVWHPTPWILTHLGLNPSFKCALILQALCLLCKPRLVCYSHLQVISHHRPKMHVTPKNALEAIKIPALVLIIFSAFHPRQRKIIWLYNKFCWKSSAIKGFLILFTTGIYLDVFLSTPVNVCLLKGTSVTTALQASE